VRDGISLAKAGVPAVVLVYDNFEPVARAQARALGMPDLRFYVFPQYDPGASESAAEADKAVKAAAEFQVLLTPTRR
jgi:CTP:molybdopterin cytidylyltransferase MocA